MLEQRASSAYPAGLPSALRSQAISPRGVCSASTYSIAPRTVGHIRATNPASCVTRSTCRTPTATEGTGLLSAARLVPAPPPADFFGHHPPAPPLARRQAGGRRPRPPPPPGGRGPPRPTQRA